MDKPGHSKFEPPWYINYFVLAFIMMVAVGCEQGFPELNPSRETSNALGKEWEPHTGEHFAYFPTEELAGVASELEYVINGLSLSQLVDVALVNNSTTLQAWEHAKAVAADWVVVRGIYYPQIGGSAAYAYSKSGGPTQGLNLFKEQHRQVGATLNYLLLDFGARSAQSEAARQALFNANWKHNQAIQDVLLNVASAYYKYIGDKAQTRADEVSLEEAKTSLEAAEFSLEDGADVKEGDLLFVIDPTQYQVLVSAYSLVELTPH